MKTAIVPIILSLAISAAVAQAAAQASDSPQSSLRVVQQFVAALERKDLDAILPLLAESATLTYPMRASGEPPPGTTYSGRKVVMGYLGQVVQNMTRIKFTDQRFTPSPDGKTVFFEANGDFLTRMGTPYRNTYVTRFDIEHGMLVHGTEYANPVTYAMTFGEKLGKDVQTGK